VQKLPRLDPAFRCSSDFRDRRVIGSSFTLSFEGARFRQAAAVQFKRTRGRVEFLTSPLVPTASGACEWIATLVAFSRPIRHADVPSA
jgi:hypothetical protein